VTSERAVGRWLAPLAATLSVLDQCDWAWLHEFEANLRDLAAAELPGSAQAAPARRSPWLLNLRRQLAQRHPPAGDGDPVRDAVRQTLVQFVCGFYDLDLRDAYGPGHGAAILAAGTEPVRRRWAARLAAGELVGIAATERHGGSRVHEITTGARITASRRWAIAGEKCWVSRLVEASGIVVFFRDPDGHITAAIIDADQAGIERESLPPSGLAGWSWGILRLHDVAIDPEGDLLAGPGEGMALFRRHFTGFRPLVAATALGTAAGVHTMVADTLAARARIGVLPRVRDNALIALGRVHAELCAAFLSTLATSHLAARGDLRADLWARVGKAYAVDTANRAVADLAPLVGAAGFQATNPIAKARQDLAGLLYADGIHDSLYRSGGISMLPGPTATATSMSAGRHPPRVGLDRAA
jgi:alkylation response protein AidB-like acyl-CoA dehydrogenase